MDWKTITEAFELESKLGKEQREKLHRLEDRAAEREAHRAPLTTETRPSTPAEPTREEKRQAAIQTLTAFALNQSQPVDEETAPTTTEQPRAADGTFAAKIQERAQQEKARRDEKRAAAEALAAMLGRMGR